MIPQPPCAGNARGHDKAGRFGPPGFVLWCIENQRMLLQLLINIAAASARVQVEVGFSAPASPSMMPLFTAQAIAVSAQSLISA